ncbi:MAG: hypothetical protein KDA20_04840 [Phycisphaerales bacterium]|nr:hypothetical protein [Phycisphaerales bacterium]
MPAFVAILLSVLAVSVGILLVIFLIVPIFKIISKIIAHIFQFIGATITDALRFVGALITSIFFVPMILGTVLIGRWSASAHYGRALQDEIGTAGKCIYRLCIGNIARLFGMTSLTEGLEQRLPAAMAQAPGSDKPSKRTGSFNGYTIVGSLKGGGSGGKLYVAEPDERKRMAFARIAGEDVDQVVIKSFSLHDGSSMPQIVRESRALEAAKKMGLVLEHELTNDRFYYVMPYVPGESLTAVSQRLHAQGDTEGLSTRDMRYGVGLIGDLLATLDLYHRGGLWHKDVKPDNIIVHDGRAHLVDFGLITPLRSAMTLTTHGTEYFRDPEMVRMALRGAKVHEVNGVKFDVYGAGAVLYALVENSFPAHGGLSQIRKRCPEALRWVIRRSMAEMSQRYNSAGQMLADVRAVIDADDPFALKPKDLPSMKGGVAPVVLDEPELHGELPIFATPSDQAAGAFGAGVAAGEAAAQQAYTPEAEAPHAGSGARKRPRIRMTDFWTGRYRVDGEGDVGARAGSPSPKRSSRGIDVRFFYANVGKEREARAQAARQRAEGVRLSAAEQRKRAQKRAREMQGRVQNRMRGRKDRYSSSPNVGVGIAMLFLLGTAVLGGLAFMGNMVANEVRNVRHNAVGGAASEGVFSVTYDGTDGNAHTLHIRTGAPDEATVSRVATVESSPRLLALPANGMVSSLKEADRALQRLQRDGFIVLGPGADEHIQKLIADAITEIGPGAHPGDPTARKQLRAWLSGGTYGLDAVLLVGTGEEAGQMALIPGPDAPTQPFIDAIGTAFDDQGDASTAIDQRVLDEADAVEY